MSLPSFLRSGPIFRRRPSLGRVPRVGSPTSSLVLRRYDFSPPRPRSLSSRGRSQLAPETARSPRFLGDPCVRASSETPVRLARKRSRVGFPEFHARTWPSAGGNGVGSHYLPNFRGCTTSARTPAVYASPTASRCRRKTRFRRLTSTSAVGLSPRIALRSFRRYSFLSNQASPGALPPLAGGNSSFGMLRLFRGEPYGTAAKQVDRLVTSRPD
jgi:hypothetical protein